MKITEWMYNPLASSGEFIEITNLGSSPVSLAGGEIVTYNGQTYQAQWYSAGTKPGTENSAWKPIG